MYTIQYTLTTHTDYDTLFVWLFGARTAHTKLTIHTDKDTLSVWNGNRMHENIAIEIDI